MSDQVYVPLQWVVSRQVSRDALADRGIVTVQQIAGMSLEELCLIAGIGEKSAPRIKALAQAYMERRAVRFKPVPSDLGAPAAFLDVRVDPDTKPQWPWGFCLMTPNGEKYRLLVDVNAPTLLHMEDGRTVNLVPDVRSAWKQIADMTDKYQSPVYYWSKNILAHVNETALKDPRQRLVTRMVDLSRVFLSAAAVPTKRDGLHDVATYLGYNAWGRDFEPYKAHIAYLLWSRDPQRKDLLKEAVDYLDHNVDAVAYLRQWLVG